MTNTVLKRISQRIDQHLCKQAIATFAACLLSVGGGMCFGITAVLLPQLQEDQSYPYDKDYDSWIASISPLAMMFGCICSGPMSDAIGRRKGQMILAFPFTLGWFVMGIASNNVTMLVGRFITGVCSGAIRPLGMVYIGEVSDPKYRAITLFCPGVAIFVGSFLSHTVGYYLNWRIVCFMFGIPNLLCFSVLLFMKESPLWLLTKGHTDVGVETFKWFRGEGELAEKELKSVLEKEGNGENTSPTKDFINIVFSKPFMKSLLSMFFVYAAVQFCGVNTISFYAQDIFGSTFGGEIDAFMLMIVTDCIRLVVTASMCMFAKKMPRRTTFLASCFTTSVVLLGLVIYLSFKPEGLIWIAVTCLIAYIGVASILANLSWSFVAEIFPSKVRGLGSGLSSLMSFSLLFISVKVTPDIMATFGEAAMFGTFAVVLVITAFCLSFILPETNGKSLQDIENTLYSKKSKALQPSSNPV